MFLHYITMVSKWAHCSYPNVPSMGMTEWWVHCFGSHFAKPKSEICYRHHNHLLSQSMHRSNTTIYLVRKQFTWGSKSLPRSTLDALISRWMIRCLQNICRYCKPLATPTATLYLRGHSRVFPLFPVKLDLYCHIITREFSLSLKNWSYILYYWMKFGTMQCRC